MRSGIKWKFETKHFTISLRIDRVRGYRYDGDDDSGEIQRDLDNGTLVAFDSAVIVELNGEEIAADFLGSSVYLDGEESQFWTAHRDSDPMNRNCSIMRVSHPAGPNVSICHYFPDMVREAVKAARAHLADIPHLRSNAA